MVRDSTAPLRRCAGAVESRTIRGSSHSVVDAVGDPAELLRHAVAAASVGHPRGGGLRQALVDLVPCLQFDQRVAHGRAPSLLVVSVLLWAPTVGLTAVAVGGGAQTSLRAMSPLTVLARSSMWSWPSWG